jgi:L,D-peptidoglycan transpeptidase YkuD (ErfK/YbiS/YcfS/YnhG family)
MIRYLLLLPILTVLVVPKAEARLPDDCEQVLVGIAPNWNSSYVTLTMYEKKGFGKKAWKAQGPSWKGRLGRSGLVWGRGIHPRVPDNIRTKREGDGRAPAGIFQLGGAYGYAPSVKKSPLLPYRQITTRDMWYEDTSSPYYNQHRVLDHEPRTTAEKKAQMKQGDYAHSLKLFIEHNSKKTGITPGEGSSIFFHIWRREGAAPTAGCTTMSEANLKRLIAAIDPSKNPLYVLLPEAEYKKFRELWKLP